MAGMFSEFMENMSVTAALFFDNKTLTKVGY